MLAVLLTLVGSIAFAAVLYQIDVQAPLATINVPTNTETIAIIGNQVTTPNPNGKAVVRCWVELTVGTGTTSVQIAVYAGNVIGGRVIGQKETDSGDFAVGGTTYFSAEFVDPFSNQSGVQYCVSVLQNGASGNGTIQNALIDTQVLSG